MSTGVFVTDVSNTVIDPNENPTTLNNAWQSFTVQTNEPLAKFEWRGISSYDYNNYTSQSFTMKLFAGEGPYNNGPSGQEPSSLWGEKTPLLTSPTFMTPSGVGVFNNYTWDIQASAVGNTAAQTALNSATAGVTIFTVRLYNDPNFTGTTTGALLTNKQGNITSGTSMRANFTSDYNNYQGAFLFQTYYELPTSQLQTIPATGTNFTRSVWVNAGSPAYFNLASGWTSIASAGQSSGETFTGPDNIGYIGIPNSVTTIGTFAFAGVTALQTISFEGGIGLTDIPDVMCRGCTSLENINFGSANDTLKKIHYEAFNGCINLNNVVIPASVQEIHIDAFNGCSSLASLTIATGSDLRTIGESAFEGSGITSFTVPGKVTAITEKAFRNCYSLTTFTIEQSENWAYGLKFVNSITTFDPTNAATFFPDYSGNLSDDIFSNFISGNSSPQQGADINFTMTKGQRINGDAYFSTTGFRTYGNNYFFLSGSNSTLTLPAMVNHVVIRNPSYSGTIVSGSNFTVRDWETAGKPMKFEIQGYESIILATITQAEDLAGVSRYFDGISSIDGSTIVEVNSITSVIFGDGVKNINNLTQPDLPLFQRMSNLTSIAIGKDVTDIATTITYMTSSLANITVDGANPNFYVEGNILYKVSGVNNTATTHNVSVGAVSGTNKYIIDSQAYPALTFTRGSTYTLNINTTGHPFWIQTTNNAGAYDSSNTYNNGVTNNGATSGTITFVVPYDAPNTLYYRCQHHTGMGNTINIVSDSGVNTKHTLVQHVPSSISSNYVVPTGVVVIGDGAFFTLTGINTLTIPTSVTEIRANAFAECSPLNTVTFTTGSQLTTIGHSAFKQTGITSITIPGTVTVVYYTAFALCTSLTTVTIAASQNWSAGISFYVINNDIFTGSTALANVNMTFGQKINTVTNIFSGTPTIAPYTYLTDGATGAFFGSPANTVINLTQRTTPFTITNPNYNTTTGGAATDGSKFTLDEWVAAGYPTNFKVVGYQTFGQSSSSPYNFIAHIWLGDSTARQTLKGYIDNITEVEIGDGVTTLEGILFDSISNLTRVKIGQHVTSISVGFVYNIGGGSSIFDTIEVDSNNNNFTVASNVLYKVSGANTKHTLVQYPLGSQLTNFSIPSGVVALGEGAMASYKGTSVTIPTSLTTIGDYAFNMCTNLSTITFATGTSSLTTIGGGALSYTTSLSSISLPASVVTIGGAAFEYGSLANITFNGVDPTNIAIGTGAFSGTSSSLQVTLYNRVSINGTQQSPIGTNTGSFFGSPVGTTINIIKAPDGFKPADRAALDAAITAWITAVDTGVTSNIAAVTTTYGDINTWDVTLVTDMSTLFATRPTFNSNIGGWNTTLVTDMRSMFGGATAFDQDISGWNTTLVTDMSTMFSGATAFDQDISGWTTTNVENMTDMFMGADAFNQDLSGWDVSGITGSRFMTYVYTPISLIPAPICFPAGSIVLTDQGNIAIEKIDPKKHTIRSHKIEGITQTVAVENYVVMIHKSTFFKNVPIRDTIISANHRVVYKNKMIQAREFVDENLYPGKIYKIPYSGDTLYNVLLENKYDLMMVNNLPVETLDPNSLNAWLFRKMNSKISNSERKEIMDAYMQRLRPTPEFGRITVGCK